MPDVFVYLLTPDELQTRQKADSPYAFIGLDERTGLIYYYSSKDKIRYTKDFPDKSIVPLRLRSYIACGPTPSEHPLSVLMTSEGKLTLKGDQYENVTKQKLQPLIYDTYCELTREPVRYLDDKKWFYGLPQFEPLARKAGISNAPRQSPLHPAVK